MSSQSTALLPSMPRPCFLPLHNQCPVQNQCVWGVPQAPPELWELRTSLQSWCTGKETAQHAGERENSHSCPGSRLGQSSGPYRPLVTSNRMCCLLEIRVHSPLSANSICISRGNSCIHCPTLLFSLAMLSLPSSLLPWCWAEVLDAGPAREGTSPDREGALTQPPILSLPLDFYF